MGYSIFSVFRLRFDIGQFKSFHRLQLSAVTWARVCYDLDEAIYRVEALAREPHPPPELLREHPRVVAPASSSTSFSENPWLAHVRTLSSDARRRERRKICDRFGLSSSETEREDACEDDSEESGKNGGEGNKRSFSKNSSMFSRLTTGIWFLAVPLVLATVLAVALLALVVYSCRRMGTMRRFGDR
jgi:hypothetical protein